MPPHVAEIRATSPEQIEEFTTVDGGNGNEKERKSSVVFKELSEKSDRKEKERQMIGRADQVWNKYAILDW